MRDNKLNISYIAECIVRIRAYTQAGQTDFMQNSMIQDAVIRNLLVIGEAIKNLSPELKVSYPEIPWRKVTGLCDVLVHNYINTDADNASADVIELLLKSIAKKWSNPALFTSNISLYLLAPHLTKGRLGRVKQK